MNNENQIAVKVNINADSQQAACEALGKVEGVDKVEVLKPQRIRITYDIYNTRWATLRERLQAVGAYSRKGFLANLRDGWREMIEENRYENLRNKPACCSKPPAGAGFRSHSQNKK